MIVLCCAAALVLLAGIPFVIGMRQNTATRPGPPSVPKKGADERLQAALVEWQLELHYQPIFTADGEVRELEALLRWNHPEHGPLPAAEFLSAGTAKLTGWILRSAAAETARWRTAGHDVRVIVNLAAADLLDEGLPALVTDTAAAAGIPLGALAVEFSETALAQDPPAAAAALTRLADAGIAVDLDGVGAGTTHWLTVARAPVSRLRIDRELVRLLPESMAAERIVAGLLGIARDLGLSGLAVGVESRAAAQRLIDLGADGLQGYALCRPLPAADVPGWLANWRAARAPLAVA